MASKNNMSLAEMRKIIEEERAVAAQSESTVDDAPIGSNFVPNTPEEVVVKPTVEETVEEEHPILDNEIAEEMAAVKKRSKKAASYDGPGLVIEKKPEEPQVPQQYTGVSPSTQNAIDAYMSEMDEAIDRVQNDENTEDEEEADELTSNSAEPVARKRNAEDDFDKAYEEAVVYIDKSGMGSVIDFSEEEHAKLTKAKTIRLDEIEVVPVQTYATKKMKDKKNFNNIIKNINTLNVTPVVLPLSGYTANIKGCTAYELMSLVETGNNVLLDAQTKWSLVHSKIQSTSIGNMDFNEFLFNTAAADFNNFVYGILCATYPDTDTVTITCPNCKTTHEHAYTPRGLIRAERMEDDLKDQIKKIVDASGSEFTAKGVHEDSPIKKVKGIKLPISGVIVELQVQSAYDLINNSIKSLSNEDADTEKYREATILATLVKRALVPDPEDPDVPYEFTDSKEIAQIIYQLRERDILIMRKIGDEISGNMTIDYGFMKIKCPVCGKFTESRDVDPERLLFQHYRQELNATIE